MSASIITKATIFLTKVTEKTIYYGKVGAELSKQIYLKEKLQPPTLAEFQTIYRNLYTCSLKYVKSPQQTLNCFKATAKNDYIKYGAYGIQLLGFYSVGEVIGRRKIVGYRNYTKPAVAQH